MKKIFYEVRGTRWDGPSVKVLIPQYESVQEAIGVLGEQKVLDLINRQNATDKMNETRANKLKNLEAPK